MNTSGTSRSWVPSANQPDCGFPLQNLPFCAFQTADAAPHVDPDAAPHIGIGIGIGDHILDLHACTQAGFLASLPQNIREACTAPHLNELMRCGATANAQLRATLLQLLAEDAAPATLAALEPHLTPIASAVFHPPVHIGNYTDFYASLHHATNVGRLFRPDQPLLPNYKYVPIGYHGRASSIVLSGTPITRPRGQIKLTPADPPAFLPTRQLDYELELAVYLGPGNALGHPIPIVHAEDHLFGLTLLNDWSARDIQSWEYQPLGPFLGKSFATTISPWVVPLAALAPYRVPPAPRDPGDPAPLPYLTQPEPSPAAIDLQLEVHLTTPAMRAASLPAVRLSTANARSLYWTFAQMVTHHTSNGCNLLPGDLLASGTLSGAGEGTQGSLLEITRRGAHPLTLPNGDRRTFLEDGDEITLTGFCARPNLPRITLGACRGTITPTHP